MAQDKFASDAALMAVIQRTFAEANNALVKLSAYNAIARQDMTCFGLSFFEIALEALNNDMLANAMRVLDEHKDAAAFWYIMRCTSNVVLSAEKAAALHATSRKLKHARDKTHFHIDPKNVAESSRVWMVADISGDEFVAAMKTVASIVSCIKVSMSGGEPLELTEYDGSDVPLLVKAVQNEEGIVRGVISTKRTKSAAS